MKIAWFISGIFSIIIFIYVIIMYLIIMVANDGCKLLDNVLRNYFIPTRACPTPHFDQTVYRYDHHKEAIEFLWVIPDQETCEIFRENK
jgi:hypothetical protein